MDETSHDVVQQEEIDQRREDLDTNDRGHVGQPRSSQCHHCSSANEPTGVGPGRLASGAGRRH